MYRRFLLLFLAAALLPAQKRSVPCSNCATWNIPQKAFRIYGDTYYVGTHGLSAILITSESGHILIDGALPESAPHIVENIKALGFRVEDIRLILNSHAHFDHAGSIAELQKLSGARVAVSPWSADVMKKGSVPRDDPQFGIISPIDKVANIETIRDGQILSVGSVSVTAHFTPGHTQGGTSWTWESCEKGRCEHLVYADSVSAVSAEGYKYSQRKDHPKGPDDFEKSFAFLESTPCDILITPHPESSNLWQRLDKRASQPDAFIDPGACRVLSKQLREALKKRLATESRK